MAQNEFSLAAEALFWGEAMKKSHAEANRNVWRNANQCGRWLEKKRDSSILSSSRSDPMGMTRYDQMGMTPKKDSF